METTNGIPASQMRTENREKTQIPQETMLEVLLWLDRFDLDGKQITTRRLRSLAENHEMPLRKVDRVEYNGDCPVVFLNPVARNTPRIHIFKEDGAKSADVQLLVETEADAQKAASYLSSCVVRAFCLFVHHGALPKNAIVSAPALIHKLYFRGCNFYNGEEDTLSATLNGSTFQSLALVDSSLPAWQIDDSRLESLRLRGCNEVHLYPWFTADFELTEEGILSYCFTLDDGLPVPNSRKLGITWANITPAFFKKVVEASKNSRLMCDVEISLEDLRFEVGNLDVGVLPSRSSEYDQRTGTLMHNLRYDIADHGNGVRLSVHFKSKDGEEWDVTVRHGRKEHGELFEPKEEQEEINEE